MSERLRVMQLLPELNSGGVERGTLEIASALVAAGHESLVVSNGGRLVPALEAQGSQHIALPIHRKALASLWQIRPLRRLICEAKPDIVHVRSRVPAWLLHFALRGLAPHERPLRVSTVHGFYSVNRYSAIMTAADAVIAVSDSVVDYIHKNYPSCPPQRITRIYRGLDPEQFPQGYRPPVSWWGKVWEEFPSLQDKQWVTLAGRITRLKGHDELVGLISSLKANHAVHAVIVGGADEKKKNYLAELEQRIRDQGLENDVTFVGHRSDMRDWLAASDVVVSLSTQAETFGRTVLESLALQTPVVGWDRGGVGEVLRAAFPEGLVPVGDQDQLKHRVHNLLSQPPQVPKLTQFTLAEMTALTLALYQRLYQDNLKKP